MKKELVRILAACLAPAKGKKTNAAEEAMNRLAVRDHQILLTRLILPRRTGACIQKAEETAESFLPDAILLVGEAPGKSSVQVERVAVNLIDTGGKTERSVRKGGPDAYFATFPVREIRDAIIEAGIPAEISMSAGTGVGNDLFYGMSDYAHRIAKRQIRIGYLRFPVLPEDAVTPYGALPSMGKTVSAAALETAVQITAQQIRKERTDD